MDPSKLLYFATIIECESLKKAAKQLNISQPALSMSMNRLEQELGQQLLTRSPTGIVPTALGRILYTHARLVREELDLAERHLKEPEGRADEMISFGTLPSLATSIIPKAVCQWRETNPATTLRVVEKNQLGLLLSLLRGEVDFIIAQTECFGFLEGMMQRVLFRDRLYIFVRPGHSALRLPPDAWAELAGYPWVTQMVGSPRTLLETLFASKQLGLPRQLTECGSVAFIKAVVTGSDSLALLPGSAVEDEVKCHKLIPLDNSEPLLNRNIAVLYREGASLKPESKALLACISAAGLDFPDDAFRESAMAMA